MRPTSAVLLLLAVGYSVAPVMTAPLGAYPPHNSNEIKARLTRRGDGDLNMKKSWNPVPISNQMHRQTEEQKVLDERKRLQREKEARAQDQALAHLAKKKAKE